MKLVGSGLVNGFLWSWKWLRILRKDFDFFWSLLICEFTESSKFKRLQSLVEFTLMPAKNRSELMNFGCR